MLPAPNTPFLFNKKHNKHHQRESPSSHLILNDEGKVLYFRQKLLGQGTYGMVYKAKHVTSNETVVIKQMKHFDDADGGMQPTMLREVSILKHLSCPYIVRLKDIFWTNGKHFCLVFEFCQMDLSKYIELRINKKKHIKVQKIKKWAYQMMIGLEYMHSHRILHRDLKPANILITANDNVKIADLGLGREYFVPIKDLTPYDQVVTLWYRAPELLLGTEAYNTKIDVWSLGLIIAEMARCKPLFYANCDYEMLGKIFSFFGTPNQQNIDLICKQSKISKKYKFSQYQCVPFEQRMGCLKNDKIACDLLKKMICLVPEKRLNANHLLKHSWFNNMDTQNGFDEKMECKNQTNEAPKRRKSVPALMKREPFRDVTAIECNQNGQIFCFGSIKSSENALPLRRNNTDPTNKCHVYEHEETLNDVNNGSMIKSQTNIREKKRSRKQFEDYDRLVMQTYKKSQT